MGQLDSKDLVSAGFEVSHTFDGVLIVGPLDTFFGPEGCLVYAGCALPDGDSDLFRGADVALVPVGGVFTIDGQGALELIERTKPVLAIPMHYRKGDQGLRPVAELSDFLKLCEGRDVNVKTLEYGESYTI